MDNNEHYRVDKIAIAEQQQQRAAEAAAVIEQRSEGLPVAFLKANFDNKKIRVRKNDIDFRVTLGIALTKICALAGIKTEISSFDGEDVMKMILSAFADLTLEEIYKSFELERYAVYEVKTEHYGLFNAEYVAAVLKKYRNWKKDTMHQQNISRPQEVQEISETEKQELVRKGIIRVFEEFKESGEMPDPCAWIFDDLNERNIIPSGTTPELQAWYQKKFTQAAAEVEAELRPKQETFNPLEKRAIKEELDKIINGTSDKVVARTKKIILTDYFKKLVKEGKHIKELLL